MSFQFHIFAEEVSAIDMMLEDLPVDLAAEGSCDEDEEDLFLEPF